jgi:hypothetical protein
MSAAQFVLCEDSVRHRVRRHHDERSAKRALVRA